MKKNIIFSLAVCVIVYGLAIRFDNCVLEGCALSLLIYYFPGLGLAQYFGKTEDFITRSFLAFLFSMIILLIGLCAFHLFSFELSPEIFLNFLLIASVVGTLAPCKTVVVNQRAIIVFLTALIGFGISASNLELVEDQDIHYLVPSYGIIKEGKPYKHVSRVPFVLEHSSGTHFMSAYSIFMMGEIWKVKYCYERGKDIENQYKGKPVWDHWDDFPDDVETQEIKELANQKKLLFAARIPHFFMAAMFFVFFFEVLLRITDSKVMSFFGSMIMLTPEMLVRVSYAGYETPTIFIFIVMAYLYLFCRNNYKSKNYYISSLSYYVRVHSKSQIYKMFFFLFFWFCYRVDYANSLWGMGKLGMFLAVIFCRSRSDRTF